jgi:hypothetical protein
MTNFAFNGVWAIGSNAKGKGGKTGQARPTGGGGGGSRGQLVSSERTMYTEQCAFLLTSPQQQVVYFGLQFSMYLSG